MQDEKNKEVRLNYLLNLQKGYRFKTVLAFLIAFGLAIARDSVTDVFSILFGLIGLGFMIGFVIVPLYMDYVGFSKD